MSKIKILVVPSDRFGVGKFRSIEPHIFLQNKFPEDFHVEIDLDPPMDNLEFFKTKIPIKLLSNLLTSTQLSLAK